MEMPRLVSMRSTSPCEPSLSLFLYGMATNEECAK